MVEEERKCVACQTSHEAAAWYSRKTASGGREYLCGAKYREFTDKGGWVQTYPQDDE